MKVVIPGGSGQVGTMLARELWNDGCDVVVLSRKVFDAPWRVVAWDAGKLGAWASELDGADAVINLAGRSVNCRYTAANREEIMESRIDSTRLLGRAIGQAERPPRVWLQMSTATIYAHRYDAPNDELTGIIGGEEPDVPDTWRFSVDVARSWEKAFDEAVTPRTRKVKLRSALILSPDSGGVFDTLLGLVRHGLGGRAGHGRQYVSWIHHHDFIESVFFLLDRVDIEGVVNLTAPHPVPNDLFMRILRQAWGTRAGLPASEWMLEVGARLMRTETELILKSRRVVPGRLLKEGFTFKFRLWPDAARDLCSAWRAERGNRYPDSPLFDAA